MEVLFDFNIRVTMSQADYNLIGRALAGKLKEEDRAPATELNKRLLQARINAHQEHIRVSQKALDSL